MSADVDFSLVSGGKNGLVSGVGNAPFLGPYNNPQKIIFNLIKAHAKGVYQHGVIPNSVSTKRRYTEEGLIHTHNV